MTAGSINVTGWHISVFGIISIIPYNNSDSSVKFGKCYFRVTRFYILKQSVSASQNISLEKFTLLISAGMARYNASVDFQCSGNQYGYLELLFADLNGLHYYPVYRRKIYQELSLYF